MTEDVAKLDEKDCVKRCGAVCPYCNGTGRKSTLTFKKFAEPIFAILVILSIISLVIKFIL